MTDTLLTQIARARELREKAYESPLELSGNNCVYGECIDAENDADQLQIADFEEPQDAEFFIAAANLPWPAIQAMAEENARLLAIVNSTVNGIVHTHYTDDQTLKELTELRAWKVEAEENENAQMAYGALHAIHELLDSGGIPRGTFADDHVRNLVALYNQRGDELTELRAWKAEAELIISLALRYKGGWREAIVELEDHCSEPVRLSNMIAAADQLDNWDERARAFLKGEDDE